MNELAGRQGSGVRAYCGDTADGAGAYDEGCWEGVLPLAVVDVAHVGYYICDEDADDGTPGCWLGSWNRLDCGRFGGGGKDKGAVCFGQF